MPLFDPTKPAANSPVASLELRNQLNALNDMANGTHTDLTNLSNQSYTIFSNMNTLSTMDTPFTTPPTAADLESLRLLLNQVITALAN